MRCCLVAAAVSLFFLSTADAQFTFQEYPDYSFFEKALADAGDSSTGFFVLIDGTAEAGQPSDAQTKALCSAEFKAAVKSIPFAWVRYPDENSSSFSFGEGGTGEETPEEKRERLEKARSRWKRAYDHLSLKEGQTVFVVADWYGNPVKVIPASPKFWASFSTKSLVSAVQSCEKAVEKERKSLRRPLEKAKKLLAQEKWKSARKSLDKVLEKRGYPEVIEAQEAMETLIAAGRKQVEAALALETDAEKKEALRKVKKTFEKTPVEAEAEAALEKL